MNNVITSEELEQFDKIMESAQYKASTILCVVCIVICIVTVICFFKKKYNSTLISMGVASSGYLIYHSCKNSLGFRIALILGIAWGVIFGILHFILFVKLNSFDYSEGEQPDNIL